MCWVQFANDGRLEDDWVPDEETRDVDEIERANRCVVFSTCAPALQLVVRGDGRDWHATSAGKKKRTIAQWSWK